MAAMCRMRITLVLLLLMATLSAAQLSDEGSRENGSVDRLRAEGERQQKNEYSPEEPDDHAEDQTGSRERITESGELDKINSDRTADTAELSESVEKSQQVLVERPSVQGGAPRVGFMTRGYYVQTDGRNKSCKNHEACYDQREPRAWCRPNAQQKWTEKGCYCDDRLKSCIIERVNAGKMEYTACTDEEGWECP